MVADGEVTAVMAMADLSASKGDYEKALALLRKALDRFESTPSGDLRQRIEVLMKLAEVNNVTGQWVDALMYLDNAFQAASDKHLQSVTAEILLASGTILSKKGKWDIALRKFDQALSIVGAENHTPLVARALVGKGIISWRRGNSREAILYARKAIEAAGTDSEAMGSALALVASAAFDMGDYALSLESNGKALEHYRRAGNQIDAARVLNNIGETHKAMGDYSKAIGFFTEGLEASGGISPRNAGYLLTNIAECHARQGDIRESRKYADMAGEKVAGVQDEYLHAMLQFVWALIYGAENEPEEASRHYETALNKVKSLGIPFDTGMILMAYAGFLHGLGKSDEAMKMIKESITSFGNAGSQPFVAKAEEAMATFSP